MRIQFNNRLLWEVTMRFPSNRFEFVNYQRGRNINTNTKMCVLLAEVAKVDREIFKNGDIIWKMCQFPFRLLPETSYSIQCVPLSLSSISFQLTFKRIKYEMGIRWVWMAKRLHLTPKQLQLWNWNDVLFITRHQCDIESFECDCRNERMSVAHCHTRQPTLAPEIINAHVLWLFFVGG